MKAVQFNEYGGPEVLRIVETDAPHAGPGQVRISVRAAGINPADWKIRAGYLREVMPVSFPSGTGFDASGVVDEVGEGVTDVSVGDAVFGSGFNTLAQYAVLTSWTRKPEDLSFEEASGYSSVVEAAARALAEVSPKSGETILVHGAAGGVGTAALQFARQKGITVIGTVTSESKYDYLRSLGAIPVTSGPDLVKRVKKLAPKGVNAALDFVGSGVIPELIELVGDPSRIVTIVDFAGPQQYGVKGTWGPSKNQVQALAEAVRLHSQGAFRMPVEATFPLEEVGEAHKRSATGRVTGKLVIKVA